MSDYFLAHAECAAWLGLKLNDVDCEAFTMADPATFLDFESPELAPPPQEDSLVESPLPRKAA